MAGRKPKVEEEAPEVELETEPVSETKVTAAKSGFVMVGVMALHPLRVQSAGREFTHVPVKVPVDAPYLDELRRCPYLEVLDG